MEIFEFIVSVVLLITLLRIAISGRLEVYIKMLSCVDVINCFAFEKHRLFFLLSDLLKHKLIEREFEKFCENNHIFNIRETTLGLPLCYRLAAHSDFLSQLLLR
jgi:hypothetical protein